MIFNFLVFISQKQTILQLILNSELHGLKCCSQGIISDVKHYELKFCPIFESFAYSRSCIFETHHCVYILHCRIHDNSVEYGIQPTLKFIEIVSNTFLRIASRSFKRQGQSTLVFCTSMQLRLNSFFYIRQTLDDVLRKRRICNSCLDLNDKGFFGSSNLSKSQTESF